MTCIRSACAVALALGFVALAAQAQPSKQAVDPAGKPYGVNKAAACALLSGAEVAKIAGRRSYVDGLGAQFGGGSKCSYDINASLTVHSGPNSAGQYDAPGKDSKGKVTARQSVAGIGDSAYLFVWTGDQYEGQHAWLVVRHGTHTAAFSLQAQGAQKPADLQPQLVAMAKAVLPRLPK